MTMYQEIMKKITGYTPTTTNSNRTTATNYNPTGRGAIGDKISDVTADGRNIYIISHNTCYNH